MANYPDKGSENSQKPRVFNRTILWWEWAVVALCVLPAFVWLPQMIDASARAVGETRALVFFYPCYAVCSGLLAIVCFKSRPVLGWIITVLLGLSDLAVAYLWNTVV